MKATTATRPACACGHDADDHSTSMGCLRRDVAQMDAAGTRRWCDCDAYTPSVPAIARARRTDPGTSHAAAQSLTTETLRASQRAVLEVLAGYPHGLTDQTLVTRYQGSLTGDMPYPRQSESGIRTRRAELTRGGLVVDTGRTERLASGRQATVWAVAP